MTDWLHGRGDMIEGIRAFDWSVTPLGPIAAWPQSFRTIVDLVLAHGFPMAMFVGPERTAIYNDAFRSIVDGRHPALLGRPLYAIWPEMREATEPLILSAWSGETSLQRNMCVDGVEHAGSMRRFDVTTSPLRNEAGEVFGVLQTLAHIPDHTSSADMLRASEERYRAFVTASSDVVYRMSPDWSEMRQLDGHGFIVDTYDTSGDWMERYILPEDRMAVQSAVDRAIATKGVFEFEHRVIRADGSPGWTMSRAIPLLGADGAIVEWLGAAKDVTERKAAELALSESEERYRALFDSIDEGFCVVEMLFDDADRPIDYRFIQTNPAFERQTGLVDAVGKTMLELAPNHERHWFQTYGRIALTGTPARFEDEAAALGRWYDVYAFRIGAPDQRRVAILFHDILPRMRAEKALRESEQRLQRVLETEAVAVLFFAPDGVLIDANEVFLRMTGYSRHDVESRRLSWQMLTPIEHRAESQAQMDRFAETGRIGPYEKEYLREDGSRAWMLFAGRDLGDGTIVEIGVDIDGRKRAEEALTETQKRLQQFGEASQDVLWTRDAQTLQWEYLTPAFETIYGLDREAALRGDNMAGWLELIVPEDRAHAAASLQRVREGEWVTFQYRVRRPVDGHIRWMRNTDFPIQDASGKVVRIGGIGHDITALKETEKALGDIEKRQRALLEGMPQIVWRAVDGGEWTWASPQWTRFTGQSEQASHGWGWLDALHPQDREKAESSWATALATGAVEVDYRIRSGETGEYRWFTTRAMPVRNDAGTIIEWLGTSTDVDDQRQLQELQKTLLAELQHRVRNILGVIRAMMRRSSDGRDSVADYVQHLERRLSALARTQVLLTRAVDARIDLEDLIRDELVAQSANEDRTSVSGPAVALPPKAAEVLSLAIHELATNSVKYGALSHSSALLRIAWGVEDHDGMPWLKMSWLESGVDGVIATPRHQGFGTELITQRIPYELKGRGTLEMAADGIRSHLEFPLHDRGSILQTDASRATSPGSDDGH